MTAPVMERPDAAPVAAMQIPDPGRGRKGLGAITRNWTDLRHTPYGTRPLAVVVFAGLATGVTAAGASYAGPFILEDLHISIQSIISLRSVMGFFLTFAVIGIGWWADRHKRIPLLAWGTVISGVFSLITGSARNLFTYGAPSLLGDMASEAAGVPGFSLMADYYPPESRGKVFVILNMVGSTAALPVTAAGVLLLDWLGWRTVFVLSGIVTVVVGLAMLVLMKEPVRGYMERRAMGADEEIALQESEPQSFGEAWRTVWAVRTLRRQFIATAVGTPGVLIYITLSQFMLAEEYGLKSAVSRFWVLGPPTIIGGLLGAFIGGAMIDRLTAMNPSRVLMIVGSFGLINALGLFGLSTIPPIWTLMVFNFLLSFGGALVGPAAAAITTQIIPPVVRTQGMQMIRLAAIPGIIFFLPMAGQLLHDYGYSGALLFTVPFAVAGALVNMSAASFFEFDRRNAFAASMADSDWRQAKAAGRGKMLVCRDVDVEYDGVQVLFGVDFDVEEGQIIALLGTNGAGKSTLLRAISGTQEASAGAIVFDGRDITHMPPHETAARGVIHMPGGRGIFPGLSVRENIVLGNWMNTDAAEEQQARVDEVFEIFPILRERADEAAASLSGGEQQMLSLAQAFLARPRLLMIDE
ncbi:MAG TPA: MFS transporter, partial [Acidimicrobiia bacterium]|nr:MFS transporter [Acidimicrobiia bacterium]